MTGGWEVAVMVARRETFTLQISPCATVGSAGTDMTDTTLGGLAAKTLPPEKGTVKVMRSATATLITTPTGGKVSPNSEVTVMVKPLETFTVFVTVPSCDMERFEMSAPSGGGAIFNVTD